MTIAPTAAPSMTVAASWIVASTGSVTGAFTITSRAFIIPPLVASSWVALAGAGPRPPGFDRVTMDGIGGDHQGRRSVPDGAPPGRRRPAPVGPQHGTFGPTSLERYGLIALEDPPGSDVKDAIEPCRRAGVKVAMVTGDHPTTAAAIAAQVRLRIAGDPVLSGEEPPADEAVLGALLDHHGIVVARVSPEDKLRIARAVRARGHVVAMTGTASTTGWPSIAHELGQATAPDRRVAHGVRGPRRPAGGRRHRQVA
jgi:hypothetical protein